MEEWKEYNIGDVCKIKHGFAFKGCYFVDEPQKYVCVTPGNFSLKGGFKNEKPKYYNGPIPEDYILKEDDLIVTMTDLSKAGDTLGYSALVPKDNNYVFLHNQRIGLIEDISSSIDKHFLYWIMRTYEYQRYIVGHCSGSTVKHTSPTSIGSYSFNAPSIELQKAIASFLDNLDDKIELNRKINANLEAQAQALFKSWFVDFEPFKDQPFVESELGMIPEGLSLNYISEIPHVLETGRRPKGGVGEIAQGIPSVGAEHVKGIGTYDYSKTKYITPEYASSLKTGRVEGYELLIYKDGGKPGYFIPNYSIFGEGYPFDLCYLNEHVFKLDFNDRGYNAFCYFYFQTDYVMNYLNAQGGKAAIPGINKQDIKNIPIYSPNNEIVKHFGDVVLPLIKQILFNCKESRRLASLRDTLLPRLMSGELKVNEVI